MAEAICCACASLAANNLAACLAACLAASLRAQRHTAYTILLKIKGAGSTGAGVNTGTCTIQLQQYSSTAITDLQSSSQHNAAKDYNEDVPALVVVRVAGLGPGEAAVG